MNPAISAVSGLMPSGRADADMARRPVGRRRGEEMERRTWQSWTALGREITIERPCSKSCQSWTYVGPRPTDWRAYMSKT